MVSLKEYSDIYVILCNIVWEIRIIISDMKRTFAVLIKKVKIRTLCWNI